MDQLRNDDPTVRRNARDGLATLGTGSVKLMMSAFRQNPSDYRIKSGVIYALSDLLRRNPDNRRAISDSLEDTDFPLLVAAASDDDKTVRFQAAEFLYTLQDPRAIPASIEAARSTRDANKADNQLLITREATQSLAEPTKSEIVRDLAQGPGSNNDLVGNKGYIQKVFGIPKDHLDVTRERYKRTECGSIIDGSMKLEWYIGDDRNISWAETNAWVKSLGQCGGSWRMPTLNELRGLFDPRYSAGIGYYTGGRYWPAHIDRAFSGIGKGSWVWAQGTPDREGAAPAFNFNQGIEVRISPVGNDYSVRAFAVR